MATLEYIFYSILMIGVCVMFAIAFLAGAAVLITITINSIKESIEDGKRNKRIDL